MVVGLFSAIKNKILRKRDDDFYDIKSRVLSGPEPPGMEPLPPMDFPEPPNFNPPYDDIPDLPPMPGREPLGINRNEPVDMGPGYDREIREIIDRLSFIENQLSAIKSQTELINERLKNVDMRINTRYR